MRSLYSVVTNGAEAFGTWCHPVFSTGTGRRSAVVRVNVIIPVLPCAGLKKRYPRCLTELSLRLRHLPTLMITPSAPEAQARDLR